jgi:enoyl-CoA hydratase/carnithine racemase
LDPVLVTLDGAVATIALNNPERLNALNKAMIRFAARRDSGAAVLSLRFS